MTLQRNALWLAGLAVVVSIASPGAQQAQRSSGNPAMARWEIERAGMLRLVVDRARTHVADLLLRVEIGTMAPIDVAGAQTTQKYI